FGARYAAPKGEGTECTQGKPCSLKQAIEKANGGDEVIVTSGTYEPNETPIFTPGGTNVQIHGDLGGPMPKIITSSPSTLLYMNGTGDSLSYVEIEVNANSSFTLSCFGARLERIRMHVVGNAGTAITAFTDCLVRNSLIFVEGTAATALKTTAGAPESTSAS